MNKYHNIKTICNQHHLHDSKFEARYCDDLMIRCNSGEFPSYVIQKTFPLMAFSPTSSKEFGKGEKICNIIIDFFIEKFNEAIEIKGITGYRKTKHGKKPIYGTPDWKIKKKIFEINYPNLKYIVINK